MISNSFSYKLDKISNDLDMNPRDLLLVMFLESGVNPAAVNPNGGAAGLIQFMPNTLKGMGLSNQEVATFNQKSAEEQLDYVKAYVQNHRPLIGGRPFTSATQYYVANFYPLALQRWHGDDPIRNANVVVVDSRSSDPRERAAYNENKILDTDKDGIIKVSDITHILMQMERTPKFQQALAQFNTVAGNGTVSEINRRKNPIYQNDSGSILARFFMGLEHLLDNLIASKEHNINKYGAEYPTNKYLISIDSNSDVSAKLEFARILSIALKEEIDSHSNIFTNGSDVEIQTVINAEKNRGLEIIKEFCAALSNTFEYSTKSIGSIKIYTFVSPNIKSNYQELDIKLADINYRKFHLKFVKGTNGKR
jgi:hypothetical protein